MKCPYRTITTETKTATFRVETDVEFKECLKGECPCYQPERRYMPNLLISESCMKVNNERRDSV